jgi:hypothetical protein
VIITSGQAEQLIATLGYSAERFGGRVPMLNNLSGRTDAELSFLPTPKINPEECVSKRHVIANYSAQDLGDLPVTPSTLVRAFCSRRVVPRSTSRACKS